MAHLKLVPSIPGLVAILCVVGCNHAADLSPDGKTVVVIDSGGAVIHDATGVHPDRKLKRDNLGIPLFSPNGKWIAIEERSQNSLMPKVADTLLVDTGGAILFSIPDVVSPYVWRPDSSELVGINGTLATVVHVSSKQVVRSYRLPLAATCATWLGDTRDMAFGCRGKLALLERGTIKTLACGELQDIGYDPQAKKIVWLEVTQPKHAGQSVADWQFCVRTVDLTLKDPTTIVDTLHSSIAVNRPGRFALLGGLSLSPDAKEVAIATLEDASKPGVLDRFAALGGFGAREHLTADKEREIKTIERQVEFREVAANASLQESPFQTSRRFAGPVRHLKEVSALLMSPHWIGRGHDFAVVYGKSVYLNPTLP